MMGRALSQYLSALLDGDPVALLATAIFLGTVLLFSLVGQVVEAIGQPLGQPALAFAQDHHVEELLLDRQVLLQSNNEIITSSTGPEQSSKLDSESEAADRSARNIEQGRYGNGCMDEHKERCRDTLEQIDQALRDATLSDKMREKYRKIVEEVLGNLTPLALQRVHAHVKEYKFYRTHKALRAALQAKYPALRPKGDLKGCFDRDGTLHLNGGGVLAGRKTTLGEFYAHELTHVIDGTGHEISTSEVWRTAWEAERNYFILGKKTATEGLAEFGQMLLSGEISREEIADVMPECLKVWEGSGL